MEHLGDITKINGHKIPVVDVMVGGSPCQDLSVAGLRKGLSGERSGLFMEQVRIFKEMRENDIRNGVPIQFVRPRVFIWENVVGALTSGNPKGEDFRIVLEEISKIGDPTTTIPMPKDGKWHTSGSIVADWGTVSWRVHDAQFWGRTYYNEDGSIKHYGTLQRRRRISVIADFSPRGDTNEILFVGKGLSRNTNESRETRESSAEDTSRSTRTDDIERAISFQERSGKDGGGKGILVQDEKLGTFTAVQKQYVCYDARGNGDGKTAHSIIGDHENRVTDYSNLVVGEEDAVFCSSGGNVNQDESVAYIDGWGGNMEKLFVDNKMNTIRSAAADPSHIPCVIEKPKTRYIVRRLLPIETERLQGFPDNWTNIGEYTTANGKKTSTSDSSRYKQMGNSIALPFWGWLLNRITIVLKRDNPNHTPTLGSLFDGVGGFPLLWAKINGVDSCLWASEIDESCIAVTKKHFGDKDHKGDIDQFLPFVHIKDD